jgi:2-dehydro-3-deoxy-D-gluconate 5-dehydrogenase
VLLRIPDFGDAATSPYPHNFMNTKRFENKVAIVTGASRGIGQAIALAFAREGAHVVSVDIGDQSDTGAKARALGAKFSACTEDFGKLTQKGAAELIGKILKEAGRVDVLVNCAGIIRRAPIVDHPEADWNALLQINLSAPFFLTQAVCKWWLTGGREKSPADARLKIVNIASMLSFQGGIFVPGYTAAKSGIAGITKAFANELAKERINCNAIAPGYIATENTRPLREDAKRNEAILVRIPEGRWGMPEDVAEPILFLASKEADYMNGTIMNVDGGWLAR